MKNKKLKNDLVLILLLLAVSAGAFGAISLLRKPGAEAVIEVDGETVAVLPLDTDAVYEVTDGDSVTNTVVIESGYADVVSADCPDKICVDHARIRYNGESIVCLPNKMIVTIRGGRSGLDAVSG